MMAVAEANVSKMSGRSERGRSFLRWLTTPFTFLFRRRKPKKPSPKTTLKKVSTDEEAFEEEASVWTPKRLNVIEKLWGEGCLSPSSAEFLQTQVPLLGLSGEKSLLLMGAGLGGLGRALVDATGVWVTGLEGDEELAALAKDITRLTGMQKRAPVSLSNLEKPQIKENAFNAAISLESLYKVKDKEQAYKAIIGALRTDGELLMTDFVLSSDVPPNDALQVWMDQHRERPALWTAEKIHFFLSSQNVDVRPVEDVTAKYRNNVFRGFFGYLSTVTKAELLEISDDLIAEVEYWAQTITAIDSGALKVFRFHVIKLPEKRKIVI